MGSARRIRHFWPGCAAALALCSGIDSEALASPGPATEAATPAPGDAAVPAPQESLFSSVKQAFKEDFDREVVRGHFDVGPQPDVHRYYCLVDEKKGKRQPNAVSGQPVPRRDGMTGIKATAVSVYSCASAEQEGLLVTDGYVLTGGAASGAASTGAAAAAPPAKRELVAIPEPPGKTDVAGVKLGMSADEVRGILKSKKLRDFYESTDTLSHGGATQAGQGSTTGGRYVNVIASWTPGPAGDVAGDAESYEVMFTPVPGKERAMLIVHSVAYSSVNAVRESALAAGLVNKYGGYAGPADVPASPTWRTQAGGAVQVGDPCNRRAVIAGRGQFNPGSTTPNLALQTTSDEFQFQIDHCGVTIVTEDHSIARAASTRDERTVARFTVAAYSPSLALDGAKTAAQLIQANASRPKDQPAPNL